MSIYFPLECSGQAESPRSSVGLPQPLNPQRLQHAVDLEWAGGLGLTLPG